MKLQRALLPLVFLLVIAAPVFGQDTEPRLVDVAQFFDSTIGNQLAENNVAGAVVALVKDGEILYANGHGWADVENGKPIDPGRTLFRVASITKLLTWTAVMQLVEEGRLDLDRDINSYLDFEVPATYPQPITMRHLLSHSGGFEDRVTGVSVASVDHLIPAYQWLPANLPARVRPPGVASSYSNYGTALAGYVVERVSGLSYHDYIEHYLFPPLGMTYSSTRQPLPAALADDLAQGYDFSEGRYIPQPFEVWQTEPASSASSTALDMAAFMIAHLQEGRYGETRILSEATVRQMHSMLLQHDPRLASGYAYGFDRTVRNGQTVLAHGGSFQFFHSLLLLFPEHEMGLFVAYNSRESAGLPTALADAFLNHYFPASSRSAVMANAATDVTHFTGTYRSIRRSYTTVDKVALLFQPNFIVRAEGGALVLSRPFSQQEQRFVEIEPLLFQEVDGGDQLAFRENERGEIELAFLASAPYAALEPVPWYEGETFTLGIVGVSLLLFLLTLAGELVGFVRSRASVPLPGLARAARWAAIAIAGGSWFFIVATAYTVMQLMSSLGADANLMALVNLLAYVPLLIVLLTAISVVLLIPVWRKRYWRLGERLYHTLMVAASVTFTWFLFNWNLIP